MQYRDSVARRSKQKKKRKLQALTVIGIDVSTAKTGIAVLDVNSNVFLEITGWYFQDIENHGYLLHKFDEMLGLLFAHYKHPILAVSESLYLGKSVVAFARLNEMYGILKKVAYEQGVSLVFEYPTKVRKKFGLAGNSSKEEIISFVNHYLNMNFHYSSVKKFSDDDLADAVLLALFGRAIL